MYSKELIEDILRQADIVSVISAFIPVQKKGRSYMAICPFHDDKNPSLTISPEKRIFKCFVCGTGGNAITFVQKHLNIPYQEAVRKVAEIIGFQDERLQSEASVPSVNKDKQSLYDTINDLQSLYKYCLNIPEGKEASDYLEKRHLDKDEIEKYGIGYALNDGEKTIEYLQKKGHSLDKIKDIGIVSSISNADANAGRLIFPLCDQNGQVVGFSARKIDNSNKETPKYVNSPDTKIFKKSHILYNYHNAKISARRDGYIYVLEGFMDVMALDKAGMPSAVALMGTSLSNEQIELLRRLNVEVRLCLDGDNPGQRGMMKIILQFNKAGIPFRLVCNPNDLRDPDDILQESGPQALKNAMNQLADAFQFQMNYYQNVEKLTQAEDRKKVLLYSLPFLRSMKDGIEKENNIVRLSKVTGFETEIIRKELGKTRTAENVLEENSYEVQRMIEFSNPESFVSNKLIFAERIVLKEMLRNLDSISFFEKNMDYFYTSVYEKIADYILEYAHKENKVIPPDILLNDIEISDDEEKEDMNKVVTDLLDDKKDIHNVEKLSDCVKVIQSEKEKNSSYKVAREELKNPGADKGAALNKLRDAVNAQHSKNKGKVV